MTIFTVCYRLQGMEIVVSLHMDRDDAESAADHFRQMAEEYGTDRSYYVQERHCSVTAHRSFVGADPNDPNGIFCG